MKIFRRRATHDAAGYEVHYEHATQPLAARFLKAAAESDLVALWDGLSLESRGLLEGRYAAREQLRLSRAAHVGDDDGDERVGEVAGTAFVREEEWKPAHLLGFVYENREWKVDLGLTAALSEEAELPDPLGAL